VLPLIAFAALLSGIVLPQKGYQRPEAIESFQQKIFSLDFGKEAFWRSNDGLTRGDLKSLTSIRFTGTPVLKVRVSNESSLYLRDYAGAVYSESGWSTIPDAEFSRLSTSIDIAPQNLHAAAQSAGSGLTDTFTLSVRNVAATPLSIWSPPGLVTRAEAIPNAGYVQDTALAFASADSSSEYTLEAIPVGMALYSIAHAGNGFENAYQKAAGKADGLSGVEGDAADAVRDTASRYIEYLFDVYTQLPDDTHTAAQALLQTYGISPEFDGNELNLAQTCQQVRTLLAERCSYNYSPPEIPEGADFATWFLQDSRSGYCVHFATTGTILLRALGIPARYAEGYIVIQKDYEKQPDEQGYIDIEDTHAHAWVEVFDAALLEWVPVEMTKSATNPNESAPDESGEPGEQTTPSFSEFTPESTPEPTPTPTPEPTPEPTAEPDSSTPDPNTDPQETADAAAAQATPTPAPTSDGTQDADAAQESVDEAVTADENQPRPPLWPVFVLLAVAGIPLSAIGYRRFKHERLLRAFRQKDSNAAVLFAVRYALKQLLIAGAPEIQPLESPEQYAYAIARKVPAADRMRLEAVLLIAQRASFSGKMCTKRERDEVIAYVNALTSILPAGMKRLKRLLFAWRFPAV
jgi:transglutaminase-like putative cysteine protease